MSQQQARGVMKRARSNPSSSSTYSSSSSQPPVKRSRHSSSNNSQRRAPFKAAPLPNEGIYLLLNTEKEAGTYIATFLDAVSLCRLECCGHVFRDHREKSIVQKAAYLQLHLPKYRLCLAQAAGSFRSQTKSSNLLTKFRKVQQEKMQKLRLEKLQKAEKLKLEKAEKLKREEARKKLEAEAKIAAAAAKKIADAAKKVANEAAAAAAVAAAAAAVTAAAAAKPTTATTATPADDNDKKDGKETETSTNGTASGVASVDGIKAEPKTEGAAATTVVKKEEMTDVKTDVKTDSTTDGKTDGKTDAMAGATGAVTSPEVTLTKKQIIEDANSKKKDIQIEKDGDVVMKDAEAEKETNKDKEKKKDTKDDAKEDSKETTSSSSSSSTKFATSSSSSSSSKTSTSETKDDKKTEVEDPKIEKPKIPAVPYWADKWSPGTPVAAPPVLFETVDTTTITGKGKSKKTIITTTTIPSGLYSALQRMLGVATTDYIKIVKEEKKEDKKGNKKINKKDNKKDATKETNEDEDGDIQMKSTSSISSTSSTSSTSTTETSVVVPMVEVDERKDGGIVRLWSDCISITRRCKRHAVLKIAELMMEPGSYVTGGFSRRRLITQKTAHMYNVWSRTWDKFDAEMNSPRREAASVIVDGVLYSVGGVYGMQALRTVERYR